MDKHKIRISVKGLFFDKKGRVLLVRGKRLEKGKEYYSAPGGGVEKGENLFEALTRELKEETGYRGKPERLVFCQDYKNPDGGRSFELFIVGCIKDHKKRTSEGDHKSIFFNRDEFKDIVFYPNKINPFDLKEKEGIEYSTYLS